MTRRGTDRFALAGLLVCLLAAPAGACSVPVFRYALERWPVEPYEVYVFHRGGLGAEDQAALGRLQGAAGAVEVRVVDLAATPDAEAASVWAAQPAAKPPWMAVRYPSSFGLKSDAWAGPLSAASVGRLLDSPARQTIARRLLDGESAVFLLLESGNREKDDAAARLLDEQLAELQKTLRIPEPAAGQWDDPVYDRQGPPANLRIAFSVVRVSRTDPAEAALVSILLVGERDDPAARVPVIFPFYGRGRALTALAGEGLSADNLASVCEFLTGACSCIVKASSPGMDILMAVDWDAALAGQASAIPAVTPPPLVGVSEFIPGEVESDATPSDDAGPRVGHILLAAGGGIAVAAVAALVVRRRNRSAEGRS